MSGETCPKCDQPRFADSPDCPFCGIVYERYRGAPGDGSAVAGAGDLWAGEPPPPTQPAREGGGAPNGGPGAERPAAHAEAATASSSAAASEFGLPEVYGDPVPAAGGDVYSPAAPVAAAAAGGRIPRRDTGSRRDGEETFLTRYLALSVLVALLVTVGLVGFWNRELFGLEEDLEMVRHGFTQLSGLPSPERVNEGQLWRLAGRRLVFFQDAEVPEDELGLLCFLYHPGSFGEEYDRSDLFNAVESRLRKLEVPYVPVGRRQIRVGGQPATQSTWRLGNEQVNFGTVAALAFPASDGKTALLVFVGKPGIVAREMRRVLL